MCTSATNKPRHLTRLDHTDGQVLICDPPHMLRVQGASSERSSVHQRRPIVLMAEGRECVKLHHGSRGDSQIKSLDEILPLHRPYQPLHPPPPHPTCPPPGVVRLYDRLNRADYLCVRPQRVTSARPVEVAQTPEASEQNRHEPSKSSQSSNYTPTPPPPTPKTVPPTRIRGHENMHEPT